MADVRRLAAVIAAVAALSASAAGACEGHAFLHAVLDPLPSELAGVRVEVHKTLGTQLVLENPTAQLIEVLDADGDPFIRIGPNGVDGNLASPSWYATFAPASAIPASAAPGAPPRWLRARDAPAFGWFDQRVDPAPVTMPAEILADRRAADLGTWTVPLRVAGNPVLLRGRFRYEPPTGIASARLTSAAVPAPGVRVTLLPGEVPGLLVANGSGEPLTVLGLDGEPFLRIGDDGVVANLNSRTWRESGRAGSRPATHDGGAGPRWQTVASVARYGWVDPRTRLPLAAPDGATQRWTVPMQLGGRPLAVSGATRWRATSPP